MATGPEPQHDGTTAEAAYAFAPRPFGRAIRFALRGDMIETDDQRRVRAIPLRDVVSVRLTFEPKGIMTRGFRLTLTAANRATASLSSLSRPSPLKMEDQREAYRAFVAALLPAIARANPACVFVAGRSKPAWALLALASAVLFLGVAYAAARLAPRAGLGPALAATGFAALFGWVAAEMVVRNRPRRFSPERPPPDLTP